MAAQTMNKEICFNCGTSDADCRLTRMTVTGETVCMRCLYVLRHGKKQEYSPLAHKIRSVNTVLRGIQCAWFTEDEAEDLATCIIRLNAAAETADNLEKNMPLAPVLPEKPVQTERDLVLYLACPYSHPTPEMREHRYTAANFAAKWLIAKGYGVISPISHGHAISPSGGIAGDWSSWQKTDIRMLRAADALVVLAIPGHKESEGVQAELEYARANDIPVSYLTPIGREYVISPNAPKERKTEAARG